MFTEKERKMKILKSNDLNNVGGGSPTYIPFPQYVVTDPAAIAALLAQLGSGPTFQVHNQLD
jgi:hypothetical protein